MVIFCYLLFALFYRACFTHALRLQEARSKKQEARSKKQEARSKKQEARSKTLLLKVKQSPPGKKKKKSSRSPFRARGNFDDF